MAVRCRRRWRHRTGKRGQSPFVRSTLRAVPANGDCPFSPRTRDADLSRHDRVELFLISTVIIPPIIAWPSIIAAGRMIVVGATARGTPPGMLPPGGRTGLDGRSGDPAGRAYRSAAPAAQRVGHRHPAHRSRRRLSIMEHAGRRQGVARRVRIPNVRVAFARPAATADVPFRSVRQPLH